MEPATGAPWRDLPERYGNWKSVYERYRGWAADGTIGRLDWTVSVGSTIVRAHQHAAVSELMVDKKYSGRGIGHALREDLLAPRQEERATLLVRPDNTATAAYTGWGWKQQGQLRPDAPLFNVLMLKLSLQPGRS
ncbi:hypothetical protein ACRB68_55420 [Actinomadura sp. RB68]|uniref:N-acetyltransferase domain-containing protein n=2 Tax=Actinomadura macrotermitis TaxID=2585200 RepID=A0A7K0C2V9_9ACTN|nr:hypothetical protein [Actinomadura macrotermitis]